MDYTLIQCSTKSSSPGWIFHVMCRCRRRMVVKWFHLPQRVLKYDCSLPSHGRGVSVRHVKEFSPCVQLILILSWLSPSFGSFSYSMSAWSAALRGIKAPWCPGLQQPPLSHCSTTACRGRIPLVTGITTIGVASRDVWSRYRLWELLLNSWVQICWLYIIYGTSTFFFSQGSTDLNNSNK